MAYGSNYIVTPDPYRAPRRRRVPRPDPAPEAIAVGNTKPRPVRRPPPRQRLTPIGGPQFGAPPPVPPWAQGPVGTEAPPVAPPAAAPPAAAPVAPYVPTPEEQFQAYLTNDADYQLAVGDANRRRQQLIDMLGSSSDSENNITTYGQLNRSLNDSLYASRAQAANAGFYSGGALTALKEQNVGAYDRSAAAAVEQTNQGISDVNSQQAAAVNAARARYSQWLKDNPIPTADPPPNESAPPGSTDNPSTPEQKADQVKWAQNANAVIERLRGDMFEHPLVAVRSITAYLALHSALIPEAQRNAMLALRDQANARYVQMTRGPAIKETSSAKAGK